MTRVRRRPDQGQDDFVMRAPGALHHARFLASCLYIMKIAMLADVLPPGLVTPAMSTKIDRMAIFISLFHGPWFLQARIPAVAPRLDLQLWQHMCLYEVCNTSNTVMYVCLLVDIDPSKKGNNSC